VESPYKIQDAVNPDNSQFAAAYWRQTRLSSRNIKRHVTDKGGAMGRSSIIYVVGLTLIVGLVLNNITHNSVSSMDTYSMYYGSTQVHNIAVSVANVGTQYLLNYSAFPSNFGVRFLRGARFGHIFQQHAAAALGHAPERRVDKP
jgi:hypothetical protein